MLCNYRAQLLGERTRQSNRLHADLAVLSPGYGAQLPAFDSAVRQRRAAALLAAQGGVRARLAERRLARILAIAAEIEALDEQIAALRFAVQRCTSSGTSVITATSSAPIMDAY